MSDIKALIVKNELSLEKERVDALLSLVNTSKLSYLSPEKEAGPFLLYCCGDDVQTIATKVNLPVEVILLTAINYKWHIKAKALQRDITAQSIEGLQKEMSKSLLVATYIAMQKQLGDVIAGRLDPEKCGLLPKNLQALEKLMTMISNLHGDGDSKKPSASTSIAAQNVQIIHNAPPAVEAPETPEKRIERLKKLEDVEM